MSVSCNLIGKNEQETIKKYAAWSIDWLKDISYDLMLTMQKLKTIHNGVRSNPNDSLEYNALYELIGSLSDKLIQKYYDDEYSFVLKNIHNSTIKMKDELNSNKPIEIRRNTLIEHDMKESYKINIPGNYEYYSWYSNARSSNIGISRNEHIFYEIDKYIHDYFGDLKNPFETEFSLIFNDVNVVKYLNECMLKNKIYSPKHKELKPQPEYICSNDNDLVKATYHQISILGNLKFNYPKIKFEYNENAIKEFVFDDIKN